MSLPVVLVVVVRYISLSPFFKRSLLPRHHLLEHLGVTRTFAHSPEEEPPVLVLVGPV
jgi:hypothetical protein